MIRLRKRLRLGVFLAFGLLLSWLISCTSGGSGNPGQLEFWTMQLKPQFTDYFTTLIADYESEHPEQTVRWVDVPWTAMESKILTAVSAKTAPDVVNLNPKFASQLASRNAWLNLDKQLSEEQKAVYLANIWEASRLESGSFGIPWYLTTQITVYNQDLLAEAGVSDSPQTYAELAQVAKDVKEKTGKYAFFATVVPEDSGEVLESLVKMGVQLVNEDKTAAFDTPEGRQAFQYWVDLYQNELLPPEALTQGHRYGIELYQGGETALLGTGAQFLETIANNAPEVAAVSAVGPQITGETGKKNVAVMNLVIPRDTPTPEKAVNFALFVTNSENQLAFAKAANVLPSTEEAVEAYIQEIEAKTDASALEEAIQIGARQLGDAEVLIPAMDNLNVLQKVIYENLQAAMLGEKTVEEAVADAASEWDQAVSGER
ncbi:sugar ABC transporter substrate-binding protein [Spirulina sp. CS-785/01]|uniref:ABC transporter substrate-binding protein n=1 Tax=Spirulina sp. CS-785/01 TaxID=3021716 RepID=UPI00232B7248|nr:sugar ABC transporter substrate-binding protein [Spirulina sp. CS-785/01]MDB9313266.1 sugar ABC transporter substrate-binding protein [Spirulina sp. CS-785/01]